MFAVRVHSKGAGLVYERVPDPSPGAGEVLIRVVAAGITPGELSWGPTWKDRAGHERAPSIPSHEVSGVVAELGVGVTHVRVGDAVVGLIPFDWDGAAAELTVARARDLARKPESLDDARAAALPLSGLAAWQALTEQSAVGAGDLVLVHGGAGGVGIFAVQLASHLGARVLATASSPDIDFVRDLGASMVIDYARDFEGLVSEVDVVIDTVGGDVTLRSLGVVRPGGRIVTVAGHPPAAQGPADVEVRFFIVEPDREHLVTLLEFVQSGLLRPVVDRVFPLSETAAAFEYLEVGHPRGKVVLTVGDA